MFKPCSFFMTVAATLCLGIAAANAGKIYLPNASFESPAVAPVSPYAGPDLDAWQKTPQPGWFDTNIFGQWNNLCGEFYNVPYPGVYIDNADGYQAAFLFALPGVGIFQDNNSLSGTNTVPAHDFNAQYNIGRSYNLTVGLIGGGGGMSNGVPIQLSFYCRDALSNIVTIASTTVTNDPAVFTTTTHFVDFNVHVPAVKSTDAWAGKKIGVEILSTVGFDLIGGYWDIDNVRLAEVIDIPNGSFEEPAAPAVSPYAGPDMSEWQKTPQPYWFDTNYFGQWANLSGEFYNVPYPGVFIDNADGYQASFLFALPGVGYFQDGNSIGGTNTAADHSFNVNFTPGKAYKLTVGLIGGGGGMSNGVPLQLALYYRDALSNQVTVASTIVSNDPTVFTTNTHFVDFSVNLPVVNPSDAWAGKNLGISLVSLVDFTQIGGYWDVDNVRLEETSANLLATPKLIGGHPSFTVKSEPGLQFSVLTSTNASLALSNWTSIGTIINTNGSGSFTDTVSTTSKQRFYRLQKL